MKNAAAHQADSRSQRVTQQADETPLSASMRGDGVRLRFGDRTVVDDANIQLRNGRVTVLVGPNGSGKSTLLRGLAKLHPIAGGDIDLVLAGAAQPIHTLHPRQFAREVTLFAQSRVAPQGLSVREVVAFGRFPYRRRFAGAGEEDRAAVERSLALTGVTHMADRAAGELSGGELQRVWLAACLAQQTGIVLLDEPTNHLDLRYQIETLELIRDLADDHSIAVGVVLHDLDHAARIADEVLLMRDGRIIARGTPDEVITAENIYLAYEIHVEVSRDKRGGTLRIDPMTRKQRERLHQASSTHTFDQPSS